MGLVVSLAEVINQAWGIVGGEAAGSVTDKAQATAFRRAVIRSVGKTVAVDKRWRKPLRRLLDDPDFVAFAVEPVAGGPEEAVAEERMRAALGDDVELSDVLQAMSAAFTTAAFDRAKPIERLLHELTSRNDETSRTILGVVLELRDEIGRLTAPASGAASTDPARLPVPTDPADMRVLVVDDEDADILRKQIPDVTCLVATSLAEALEIVEDHSVRIDGALVDICIDDERGDSGHEVLRTLRRERPHVPRVVVSIDPTTSIVGDVAAFDRQFAPFATLRKAAPGQSVPGLREVVTRMLDRSDEDVRRMAGNEIDFLATEATRQVAVRRSALVSRRWQGEDVDAEGAELDEAATAIGDVLQRAQARVATPNGDPWAAFDLAVEELTPHLQASHLPRTTAAATANRVG